MSLKGRRSLLLVSFAAFGLMAVSIVRCGSGSTSATSGSGTTTTTRTISANVTSGTTHGTCAMLTRDTTSCQTAREALGLTGNWLKFSCNVTLGLLTSGGAVTTTYASATYVTLTTSDIPDHTSNYFPTSGTYSFTANSATVTGNYTDMYKSYTTSWPNPSYVSQQSFTMKVPIVPVHSQTSTSGKFALGLAIDGVEILDSAAATTDNIFNEAGSFDECQGHPNTSGYHYHTEPWTISYDDNNLIGIMIDGYWVYGRRDFSSTPSWSTTSDDLYVYGGHVGADPLTNTGSAFHYHVTAWTTCLHESISGGSLVRGSDDGATSCTSGGTLTTAYFIMGHGNGGIWKTVPSGVTTNTTAAVRYTYGAMGTCSGGC
jgi:hypothetical protein